MAKLWDRQEGESTLKYGYFCTYRDMQDPRVPGSKRSVSRVAEMHDKSTGYMRNVSNRHKWAERVKAWDDAKEQGERKLEEKTRAKAIEAAADGHIKEIMEMRARHATLAHEILVKAAEALSNLLVEEIKPSDITRMVDVAAKLERISRGDVGDVVEERQGEPAAPAVTFYMPSNGRDKKDGSVEVNEP